MRHCTVSMNCGQCGQCVLTSMHYGWYYHNIPDNKVHGANMGPTWVLSGPMLAPRTLLSGMGYNIEHNSTQSDVSPDYFDTFHWSLFPMVQITIFQHRFRQCIGAGQGTSHYLNQWLLVYWGIYVPLCLKKLTLHVLKLEYFEITLNTMIADALAPCVGKPSDTMVFIMQDEKVPVFC